MGREASSSLMSLLAESPTVRSAPAGPSRLLSPQLAQPGSLGALEAPAPGSLGSRTGLLGVGREGERRLVHRAGQEFPPEPPKPKSFFLICSFENVCRNLLFRLWSCGPKAQEERSHCLARWLHPPRYTYGGPRAVCGHKAGGAGGWRVGRRGWSGGVGRGKAEPIVHPHCLEPLPLSCLSFWTTLWISGCGSGQVHKSQTCFSFPWQALSPAGPVQC